MQVLLLCRNLLYGRTRRYSRRLLVCVSGISTGFAPFLIFMSISGLGDSDWADRIFGAHAAPLFHMLGVLPVFLAVCPFDLISNNVHNGEWSLNSFQVG